MHLFLECIIPESILALFVDFICMFNIQWNIDAVFMGCLYFMELDGQYDYIALPQSIGYPPCKHGLVVNTSRFGKF